MLPKGLENLSPKLKKRKKTKENINFVSFCKKNLNNLCKTLYFVNIFHYYYFFLNIFKLIKLSYIVNILSAINNFFRIQCVDCKYTVQIL